MRIFLSYPIQSRQEAQKLAAELKQAGFEVWAYFLHVPASDSAVDTQILIQKGIESADVLLVLVSTFTRKSPGIQREIIYAQHRNIPVLPVIIEPRDPIELLPLNLLETEYFDLLNLKSTQLMHHLRTQFTKIEKIAASEAELVQNRERILTEDRVIRVFIAYSHRQRTIAKEIADMLVGNGQAVFWDAKIKAGATWRQTIQKALDDATHVVVIWTPEAAQSDEVEREVSYALAERKVIIPILSQGIAKLPYHLHGLHYIVLREDISLIEADLLSAIEQFSQDDDLWH